MTETEIRFAISDYDNILKQFYSRASLAYQRELAKPETFITSRSMYKNPATGIDGYVDCLPTYQGQILPEIIEQKVKSHKKGKVNLVDVGFGQGNFLLDCRRQWGHHINLIGYGTPNYAASTIPSNLEKLHDSDVQIVEGNVINMARVLDPNFADVIVGCHVLQHTRYPALESLKQCYNSLAKGGVALFNAVSLCKPTDHPNNDFRPFERCLQSHGYDFALNNTGAAFSKHKAGGELNVPIYAITPLGSAALSVISDPDLEY